MYLAPVMFVFIPILAAILIFIFMTRFTAYIILLAQTSLIVIFILFIKELKTSPEMSMLVFGGWDERFAISFFNDNLSLIMIGLTILIMTIVLMYSFRDNQKENLFFFLLLFLEGIFLGALQTNDLFNLFIFVEVIMVLTTILISFKKKGTAFKAAIYYLLVNSVGALFFLIGIILIYYIYGTMNIQILSQSITLHSDENLIKLAFVFMVSGISIKAALFPLFAWLPRAHAEAKSCISALLSGLVVKVGLYVFARIYLKLFLEAEYDMKELFFYLGVIGAIVGIIFALSQKDIKLILAYHTVSQIGIMLMGLALTSDLANIGGVMHIMNHALFKSLLFLGTGMVIKRYQTRNISEIRGVFKSMPWTAIFLIIGILSITGAPLFNGFVSKSLIAYDLKGNLFNTTLFSIICIGTVTSFLKFSQIFFGPKQLEKSRRDIFQNFSISLLGLACIVIGTMYIPIGKALFNEDLSIINVFYWKDWILYIAYIIIGWLLYRFVISKEIRPLVTVRQQVITFENFIYLFVLYLVFLSAFVFLF